MSFERLRRALSGGGRLFSPFFVLGDPTPELSVELCVRAVDAGAGALELGFPFSDPVADGPEVAAASARALRAGTSTARALALLGELHARTDAPLNLLVYGNLIHARGWARFCADAVAAGASSLLAPDVGLEESPPLARACADAGLGFVQLVGPTTPDARVRALGASATAMLYLVSHQGITGVRDALEPAVRERIARVAELGARPVCVGFGLSRPEHVRAVFDSGASVAVVGSAFAARVRRFAEAGLARDPAPLLSEVAEACRVLATAASPLSLQEPAGKKPCS